MQSPGAAASNVAIGPSRATASVNFARSSHVLNAYSCATTIWRIAHTQSRCVDIMNGLVTVAWMHPLETPSRILVACLERLVQTLCLLIPGKRRAEGERVEILSKSICLLILASSFSTFLDLALTVDDGDRVNREQEPSRQLYDWRGSDRRRNREKFSKQGVEHWERGWIRQKAGDLDDALEATTSVLEHCLEVRECLSALRFKGIAGDFSGSWIDSGLARGVHEVADTDGLRVWSDPGDAGTLDNFRLQRHVMVLLNGGLDSL
jgi:hypothetical protein